MRISADKQRRPAWRAVSRVVSLAAVIGVGSPLPLAGVAEAAPSSNTAVISVPAPDQTTMQTKATPFPSTIALSGMTGAVTDVNVTLCGLSATFPSDLDVMLVAPNGTRAVIMSDVGGNGEEPAIDAQLGDAPVTNLTLTLDDAAPSALPADAPLAPGRYRPLDDDLHEFDPDDVNADVFTTPAPPPSDPVGVFRPLSGVWFFRSDADNVALSSFNGIDPNGTWSLYVMDDVPGSSEEAELQLPVLSCGWSIDVTTGGIGVPAGNGTVVPFGAIGDIPVPGDYDGNGSLDTAVFRPLIGMWFVQGGATVAWGAPGDIPVPGDYDGDGDTDMAVFRPSSGLWFVKGGPTVAFGTNGDVPVPADYDGDDDTDMAVFRPATGSWFVKGPLVDASIPIVTQWGTVGDIPTPGDYDGDGRANVGVFRPSSGFWFIQGVGTSQFGTNGDIPSPQDYNNDGAVDVGVFRPSTGTWFVRGGAAAAFGTSGDVPLPTMPAVKVLFFL